MDNCELCGSGVVYRINPDRGRSFVPSAYAWVCLRDAEHVFADRRTLPTDPAWSWMVVRAS